MKLKSWFLAASAAAVSTVQLATAADITGKVTVTGATPDEKVIAPIASDQFCGKLHTEAVKTRFFVKAADGGLDDVFVHIKDGLTGKTFEAPATPAVLDQVGCLYQPYILGIQTGQKLVIKNSDPMMHNINCSPKNPENKPFNEAQMAQGADKEKAFTSPEIFVTFQCNVHPWMFAYACVSDNPFFDVTKKGGSFKIANLPPGKYVIEAIHRKAGKVSKEITVGADNQTVDLTLEFKPAQ